MAACRRPCTSRAAARGRCLVFVPRALLAREQAIADCYHSATKHRHDQQAPGLYEAVASGGEEGVAKAEEDVERVMSGGQDGIPNGLLQRQVGHATRQRSAPLV
jgi:hypothetical protein